MVVPLVDESILIVPLKAESLLFILCNPIPVLALFSVA
jgi:hypothetical protein